MAKDRQGKCTPEVIRKVGILIMRGLMWAEIAEVFDVTTRTMEYWRNKDSPQYEPEFAEAVEEALRKYNITPIKEGQFTEAKKHVLVKKVKEIMLIDSRTKKKKVKLPPPAMPPSNYSKKKIIAYADDFLDLLLDEEFTADEMRRQCRLRIDELTEEVMVTVKEYEQEVDSNPNAVKNVMTNCGREDERWNFAQDLKLGGEINLLPPKITKHEEIEDENCAA